MKNLTLLLVAIFLLTCTAVASAQQVVFVPSCIGVAATDTARFTAIKTAVGTTNPATIKLPWKSSSGTRCRLNSLTLTSNITLDGADGGVLVVVSGQTLTIQGPVVAPPRLLFSNATAGLGTISFSGNHSLAAIYPHWWGAIGDGASHLVSGKEIDGLAIQAAIDTVALTGAKCRVRLLAGQFLTSDTIHIGYGHANFGSVVVEGEGYMLRGQSSAGLPFNGTAILAQFSDRPAINFQGGRGSVLRGVAIKGLLSDWITDNQFSSPGVDALIDDTDPDNWDDPSLAATQDSRYAPYAGVSIDAYSGVRPATSYPDVVYPASMGVVPQYGKAFSNNVLLEDVYIDGFTVGVVNQPCDADGNGDFTELRRVVIERCKWGMSVGNTQSRNVHISASQMYSVYSALTNRRHGKQQGYYGGEMSDLSVAFSIQIADLNDTAYPITFTNLYGEGIWRIGDFLASSSVASGVQIIGCNINFDLHTNARGVPATILTAGAQQQTIQFKGGRLNYTAADGGVFGFGGASGSVRFDGTTIYGVERTNPYEQFASNYLNGGVVLPQLTNSGGASLRSFIYDLDTGLVSQTLTRSSYPIQEVATRNRAVSLYATQLAASSDPGAPLVRNPLQQAAEAIDKTSLSSLTLVDKTLTIVFTSRTEAQFARSGPLPGDVIWDDGTGSVFFVRSRTGTTVLAELQNNFKADGAGFDTILPFSASTGNLYFGNSRLYVPLYYLRCDVTSGSAVLTNCARDDGFAAWYNAQIAVGDAVFVNDTSDLWVNSAFAIITARDQAAGTITLSGVAAKTQTRRLDVFIRQPPANF